MNRHGERGQTLVVNVLALVAMIGFAMLVMDGGSFLLSKRNLQGAADAAALAGVRSFPEASAADATAEANDYATGRNAEADASVEQVVATETGGTCTIEGVTKVLPPFSVCVTVEREDAGVFLPVFGKGAAQIEASSIASVSQLQFSSQWLPFGVQTSLLDLQNPTTLDITPGAKSDNVGGMINLAGQGGAPIVDVITGEEYPDPVGLGDPIDTQTGVLSGAIENAFAERLAGNTDAFYDVFGQAPDGTWYVKDGDSPRLGLMPVAEDTAGIWPLQADAAMTVKGLVLVYIGKTDDGDTMTSCGDGCPGTSGKGNSKTDPFKVHLTPVNAPLPDSIDAGFGDYDPDSFSPVVYRMTS